jgi:hypothetical protein
LALVSSHFSCPVSWCGEAATRSTTPSAPLYERRALEPRRHGGAALRGRCLPVSFHGLSKWENRLLNVAGGAIIFVAWIPMYVSELVHRGLAVLFFLMIGIVAICFSKGRIKDVPHQRARRVFASQYTGAGIAMIALPLSIAVLQFTPWRFDHYMFWIEFFAIMSFAIYWFVKTADYRMLLGIRWFAP